MIEYLKGLLKNLVLRLPIKNWIVFESAPDLSDNTFAVFEEMVKRGMNKDFKLIWFCFDDKVKRYRDKNVSYIYNSLFHSYIANRAKVVICCNRFVYSQRKKAINIYLGHGNPLKNTKGYYMIPDSINYILASSEGMKKIRSEFYGYNEKKIIPLGYPRNDILVKKSLDLHQFFPNTQYEKLIVWYPTVRQFKAGRTTGSSHALPLIWNENVAAELNDILKKNQVVVVLKPHFAQNIDFIKKLNLSNIIFIDDSFFKENNITSYQFVGSCDALLTDFSSIYYDFTLCDKPIGLIWEDYDEYKENPGFAVDMDFMMKGGVKIYSIKDFRKFIEDVARGNDRLKIERNEIRDFANGFNDGQSASRVANFLLQML